MHCQERRAANIKALLEDNLVTTRKPMLSRFLCIQEGEQVLRQAFKSPAPGAPAVSDALRRKLAARKAFVPWGDNKPFSPLIPTVVLKPTDPVPMEQVGCSHVLLKSVEGQGNRPQPILGAVPENNLSSHQHVSTFSATYLKYKTVAVSLLKI